MNYLIIPDIHNRIEWAENLIARFPGHLPVFLGDYFDNYHDTPEDARRTAEWLRRSISRSYRVHLMGNHDLPYCWPSRTTECPGWTSQKHKAVGLVMEWARRWMRFTYRLQVPEGMRPILLSHAGISLANLFGVDDSRDVAARVSRPPRVPAQRRDAARHVGGLLVPPQRGQTAAVAPPRQGLPGGSRAQPRHGQGAPLDLGVGRSAPGSCPTTPDPD